jgi:hypothetical protein
MAYDYSDAPPPRDELIPHNTLATVQMRIRPGNAGETGLLRRLRNARLRIRRR